MDRSRYLFSRTEDDRKLIALFKDELGKLDALYLQAIRSNDMSKANALLRKMRNITDTLDAEYGKRADKRIPQEYLLGSKYIDDIFTAEASYIVIYKATKKELTNMVDSLGAVHVDAVNALLNNSKNYVKSSLDGMERQALTLLNDLQQEKVREQLARGIISGDSLANMKNRVSKYLIDSNITSFKDRAGRTRDLNRYVDMVTRTETSIANVQGTINRAIQLGITKFRIVEQADCCDICSEYRSEVVDIADGTVDLPPYHPNCRGYIIAAVDSYTNEYREAVFEKIKIKKY